MTTIADKRIATLTAAAKSRSDKKTKAAQDAIRALVKRGEPITFQAVGREANVSHAFLYNHPDLRSRIEHLRSQAQPTPRRPIKPEENDTLVLALTTQISNLKQQHRQEVQALKAALEQAHGENLDLRREIHRRGWTPRS